MASLFGGGSRNRAPAVTPVATMPDEQNPAVLAARRRSMAEAASRGGRASTILTAPESGTPLGASTTIAGSSDYQASSLGGR
ncbi:hypothetical protein [Methylobacterium iners]|uniref:Uncharacterized protein n=1 Tax=Methylobacterium iners TaxID=418707 RepID=A0ABQ4RT89_9HYPH|nr:hypothetical protein [Methylobacterium iners]GJD92924.1 hypothetical protein OCOJLMKI_0107 [Methylobacterium iners]